MSVEYQPDPSASPIPPWDTIFLANRDLAAAVPINFVTHAGVSLSSACYPNGTLEDSQLAKCLSNLLAAHVSRFFVDIYWDPRIRQFNLCSQIVHTELQQDKPSSAVNQSEIVPSQSSLERPSESSRASVSLSEDPQARPAITDGSIARIIYRQVESLSPSGTVTRGPGAESLATSSEPVTKAISSASDTVYKDGSTQCSSSLNLGFLSSLVLDYIQQTSDTLSANLLFFQFNLYAAASHPDEVDVTSPLSGPDLPSSKELVGALLDDVFSPSLYQPSDLRDQRANLNDSWYTLLPSKQPISEYFTTDPLSSADISSADGWPNEYFTELDRFKRILFAWGSIEPQMEGYNFSGDSDIVFSSEYLSSPTNVASDSVGQIESGCFHDSVQNGVSQVNSSWAISYLKDPSSNSSSLDMLQSLVHNLTSCGITPVLDSPLDNQTAQQNPAPYVTYVQSTVWNWAPGEPRNASITGATSSDDEDFQAMFRCALMMTSLTSYGGRWRVELCDSQHPVACRVANQPYLWRLSSNSVSFSESKSTCERDSTFSAPRTGLENKYLYQHVLSLPETSRLGLSSNDSGVWINLNSLDTQGCWVTAGPDGTCPYKIDEAARTTRTVLVPTIATLIILVLTASTLFVKCNKNRRNSRKKIRGEGGWNYEGVPS